MQLNQDDQCEAAVAFATREGRYYDRYCADLPEMQAAVSNVHAFSPTVIHAYDQVTAKEVFLRSHKTSRGEKDRRSSKRAEIEELIRQAAARHRQS